MNKGFCAKNASLFGVLMREAPNTRVPWSGTEEDSPARRGGLGERSKKDKSLGDGTAFENMLLVHVLR